ncbi:MAG: hypothetical protein M3O23_09695, partial [Actinomycetota bacterium]|nr:hypothetical protein [Actinomycetota bacterium]
MATSTGRSSRTTSRGTGHSKEVVSGGGGGPTMTGAGVMPGGAQMEDWRENPLDPMAPIGV